MKNALATLRVLLAVILLGAAYVFWGNTGMNAVRAITELRAASQVLIVLGFLFYLFVLPKLLPERRDVVNASLAGIVGFFILANSLGLLRMIVRGTLPQLSAESGLSIPLLLGQHLFNIVLIPALLGTALVWTVNRASTEPHAREFLYWTTVALAVIGLAYISLTVTWTI